MLTDIRDLYEYNRWANSRVLRATAGLTSEQLLRDLGNSYPAIRDTLVHILGAEWIWLSRWRGTSPPALPDPKEFPSHEILSQRWRQVEAEQARFISTLSESSLGQVISYVNTRGEQYAYPLRQMLWHVVNHASYHRGQITTMLRQIGAQPVATDYLVYQDEKEGA